MEWILAIFESVSNLAKFFAIIIPSIVAIFVVLLNNYFSRKSAKRSLEIEKLESFYKELVEFKLKSRLFIKKLFTKEEDSEELREVIKTAINSVESLQVIPALYFPKIKFDTKEISRKLMEMYSAQISTRHKGGDDWAEKERDCYQYVSDVFDSISAQCIKQMKNIRH